MSTMLFSGILPISAGEKDTPVFQPPQGFETIFVSMDADQFPAGTTTLSILLSFDGGNTFPSSNIVTWTAPHTFPAKFAHKVNFSFSLAGANRAKVHSSSPSAFSTQTDISAQ
jgi:hypothetical protein